MKEGDKKWKNGELFIYHFINRSDKGWNPASKTQLYKEIKELKIELLDLRDTNLMFGEIQDMQIEKIKDMYTKEEVQTIIRCGWNEARTLLNGKICDPKQLKEPEIYKHSWTYNWSEEFLKRLKMSKH